MDDNKKWKWKLPDYQKMKDWKYMKKDRLVILLLVGILLLVISIPAGGNKEEKEGFYEASEGKSEKDGWEENLYTEELEVHLEELFSHMDGAGQVEVMITLASSSEKVVEKDTNGESETIKEEDSAGGNRTTTSAVSEETTVYGDGESNHGNPYVSKELTPKVEGVVVLASGGDNAVVKKNITEATQALFGIDTHKIKIIKKSEN